MTRNVLCSLPVHVVRSVLNSIREERSTASTAHSEATLHTHVKAESARMLQVVVLETDHVCVFLLTSS